MDMFGLSFIEDLKKRLKFLDENSFKEMQKIPVKEDFGENFKIYNGEAIKVMSSLPDNSVDLICVDLPYGVTQNKWDKIIPLDLMWDQFHRVGKKNAAIVLTATEPFASLLIMSNIKNYKYDLIWEKTISSGQLNVAHQPMRNHENIPVFYRKKPTYNEQLTEGTPYKIKRTGVYGDTNYNAQKSSEKENTGFRHAKSIMKVSNPRIKGGQNTQKPVALIEKLIKMYSNEGDVVLDCCMGFGTTGVASINTNRKFIGIEIDELSYNNCLNNINVACELKNLKN